jgi:hypothetical protein
MESSSDALTGLVIHRCQAVATGDDWSAVISVEVTGHRSQAIVGRKLGVFYQGQLVGQGLSDEWGYATITTQPLSIPSPRRAPQELQVRHQEPLFIVTTAPFTVPLLPHEVTAQAQADAQAQAQADTQAQAATQAPSPSHDAPTSEAERLQLQLMQSLADGRPLQQRPVLRGQDLSGVNCRSAQFKGAVLERCTLKGANFTDADLRYADLRGADLSHAKLWKANLTAAVLSRANLQHADLTDAILQGADLQGADLTHAILTNVCWDEADLSDIQGLDLSLIPARRLKLSAKQYQEIQQLESARQEAQRRQLEEAKEVISAQLAQLSATHQLGDYVYIPPGSFIMGSPQDGGPMSVTLSAPFWLKTTPVTQAEWLRGHGQQPLRTFKGRRPPPRRGGRHGKTPCATAPSLCAQKGRPPLSACPPRPSGSTPAARAPALSARYGDLDARRLAQRTTPNRSTHAGRPEAAQRLGPVRHARQRLGVVPTTGTGYDPSATPARPPRAPPSGGNRVIRGGAW